MEDKFIEIVIDTEEIEEHLFNELTKLGYVPEEDEMLDLVDIVFELFLKMTGAEELDLGE